VIFADCGNTTVKLAHGSTRTRLLPGQVAAWLAAHPAEELILLPGAAASAAVVRHAWHGRLREVGRELPLPELGQYPGMGADRILAGVAAGAATIVVDAGTATTLTAWGVDGRFAGGLILPGPAAMIAGLRALAPALPAAEALGPNVSAARHDTRGAIGAGAGIGHAGMVTWCLARLQEETGILDVITTGGGACDLSLNRATHRPWLVLEGLQQLSAG